MLTILTLVELETAPTVWTPLTNYIDNKSNLRWRTGVGPNRQFQSAAASFSLNNNTDVFTPTNKASSFFNKLRIGARIRISTTYAAVTDVHFIGAIFNVRGGHPETGRKKRVAVQVRGLSTILAKTDSYGMNAQENKDVDDILAAIMTAAGAGIPSTFEDSPRTVPVVVARADPLSDMVAVATADPGALLWEDGAGMRFKASTSMTGGYATPDRTWGPTIKAIGLIEPDYRDDALFARQTMRLSAITVTNETEELYRHPFNAANGLVETLAPGAERKYSGVFSAYPATVHAQFTQTITPFVDSGGWLYSDMDATQTLVSTEFQQDEPNVFRAGSVIRIHDEVMFVTNATVGQSIGHQLLTVTRGEMGTVATTHKPGVAPGPNLPIYHRQSAPTLTAWDPRATTKLTTTITSSTVLLSFLIGNGSLTNGHMYHTTEVGDSLKIDNEIMRVTNKYAGPSPTTNQLTVARGQSGTAAAPHTANAIVQRVVFSSGDVIGPTHVLSSYHPSGFPATSPEVVGIQAFPGANHVYNVGRRFVAGIRNGSLTAARQISELVISGTVYRETTTPTVFSYERAIPGVPGLPEGPPLQLPYGAENINIARGALYGSLRANRVSSPWLELTFSPNVDNTHALSILRARMGDLVRYTGTASNSENIDDWFRIMAIETQRDGFDVLMFTFTLMPAHLNRRADRCFYTDFNWRNSSTGIGTGLGEFVVEPSGAAGWLNDAQYQVALGFGTFDGLGVTTFPTNAFARNVANPTPALVNVGTNELVVGGVIQFSSVANERNTYPANTGGVGYSIRSTSDGSQGWEVRFNRSTQKLILWNSSAGVVKDVPWVTPSTGFFVETEIWFRGSRVQVFLDGAAEPVIDEAAVYSPGGGTHAGLRINRTIVSGSGEGFGFVDFYAQGF